MTVPMVNVRVVRMLVGHRSMVVMNMRLTAIPREIVLMLVVFIMPMGVGMLHRVVRVFVLMPFTQMQPHAKRH